MITTVDIKTGKVTQRELTQDEINALPIIDKVKEDQERLNTESRQYLLSTDWYVIRFQENGTPIPEEITLKRQEARANIKE